MVQSDGFIFLKVSQWRCLQKKKVKKAAGTRTIYQYITAALQFSLSLHRSQRNLSASLFELYIQCLFLIVEENGLPQWKLNCFLKMHKETLRQIYLML